MRAYVFTDAALKRHAGRFVWLSMNTERTDAGPFLEKFPISSWPTFLFIDPGTERAALRWMGSATVAQMEKLLDDGERAVKGGGKGLEAQLAAADQAFAAERTDEAARLFAQLAASAPKDWPKRPRAVEMWLLSLSVLHKVEECAETAAKEMDQVPRGPSYASVVGTGLDCAQQLPATEADRGQLVEKFEKAATAVLDKRDIAMAADDYSGLYDLVAGSRAERGDEAGARAMTEAWSRYLEEQAEKAPTAEARTVFDGHRLGAYLKLKAPEKAVAMLQASEKALPGDFNPPARLAVAYRELRRWDDALAASDRALGRANGPRRLRILSIKADIQLKKGDPAAAKKTLDDALAFAASLPKSQQYQGTIDSLKKQRAELEKAPGKPEPEKKPAPGK
jgi:hypothetical protein